jgi:hypothetical protein
VIIDDLNTVRVSILPNETYPVSIVDPYTVLPGAAALESLQGIAGRAKIVETPCCVKLKQFPDRNLFDSLKLPGSNSQEDLLGFSVTKGPDQVLSYIDLRYKLKGLLGAPKAEREGRVSKECVAR